MLAEPGRLSAQARDLLLSDENELFLSAASSWEIVIKQALGRLNLPEDPGRYVPDRMAKTGTRPLAIEHSHALQVAKLPRHHRDPFDRILIAQAQVERLPILTADRQFARYEVELLPP